MKSEFKLWSETNNEVIQKLKPNLEIRDWDNLSSADKEKIWLYFFNKNWFQMSNPIFYSILTLNEKYRAKSFGIESLRHGGPHILPRKKSNKSNSIRDGVAKCCQESSLEDFESIFISEEQDVVYELISIFVQNLITPYYLEDSLEDELMEELEEEYKNYQLESFIDDFNIVFEQFNLNVLLSPTGFFLRQDSKITEEIYLPVLSYLSDKKFFEVNRELNDAFSEFVKKTPQGYSGCITHTVSALQAFMQIVVKGKTGKGDLNDLVNDAQKKALIPNDLFSKKIFKDIVSILMEERQNTSDSHPKKEYANEKNSKLLLNLVMIFIQHCILK